LHGKATVIDGDWTTIGSFNLNFLSAFESIELNLEISNPEFSATFKTVLEKIMKNDCTKIDSEDFEKKYTFIRKAQDWFAYQVIRYAMRFPLLFAKRLTNPLDSHGTRPHYPDGTRF
jgi:cardiolipin synthase